MTATHTTPHVLGTHAFHAILTHKQADVIGYIYGDDRAVSCREIADCLHELQTDDLHEGRTIHYAPPSYGSIYATLQTLERRGFVKRRDEVNQWGSWAGARWDLTDAGERVVQTFCL